MSTAPPVTLSSITNSPITKSISSVLLTIFVAVLVVVAVYILMTTLSEPSLLEEECETAKKDKENIDHWFTVVGFGSALFAAVAGFALWHGNRPILRVCQHLGYKWVCHEYVTGKLNTAEAFKAEFHKHHYLLNVMEQTVLCRQGNVLQCVLELGDWGSTFDQDIANLTDCTEEQLKRVPSARNTLPVEYDRLQPLRDLFKVDEIIERLIICRPVDGLTRCQYIGVFNKTSDENYDIIKKVAAADPTQPLNKDKNCHLNGNEVVILKKGAWSDFDFNHGTGRCVKGDVDAWITELEKETKAVGGTN